jgi:hypothetical protein
VQLFIHYTEPYNKTKMFASRINEVVGLWVDNYCNGRIIDWKLSIGSVSRHPCYDICKTGLYNVFNWNRKGLWKNRTSPFTAVLFLWSTLTYRSYLQFCLCKSQLITVLDIEIMAWYYTGNIRTVHSGHVQMLFKIQPTIKTRISPPPTSFLWAQTKTSTGNNLFCNKPK